MERNTSLLSHEAPNRDPIRYDLVDKISTLHLLSLVYFLKATPALFCSSPPLTNLPSGAPTGSSCAKHLARTTASSSAAQPPWPMDGSIWCIASPATVTVPLHRLLNAKCHGARYLIRVSESELRSHCFTISITSAGQSLIASRIRSLMSFGSFLVSKSRIISTRLKLWRQES